MPVVDRLPSSIHFSVGSISKREPQLITLEFSLAEIFVSFCCWMCFKKMLMKVCSSLHIPETSNLINNHLFLLLPPHFLCLYTGFMLGLQWDSQKVLRVRRFYSSESPEHNLGRKGCVRKGIMRNTVPNM